MNEVGCTAPSVLSRTFFNAENLNAKFTLGYGQFSSSYTKNTTWITQTLSLTARVHFAEGVTNMTSISDKNDMEIGTVIFISVIG